MNGDIRVFDRFARLYDLVMPSARQSKLTAGLAYAQRDVERIVDVAGGSGRGVLAADVAERLVVDAAGGMVKRAQAKGLGAVQGDVTRLPLCGESVDAVLIVDALHHIGDRDSAVMEAARVLRPGGVFVIVDFDPTTVRGRALVAGEHAMGFDSRFEPPRALAARMRHAGFDAAVVEDGFGYVVAGIA